MRLYLTSLISQLINSEPDAITYAYIFEMIDIFLEDTEKVKKDVKGILKDGQKIYLNAKGNVSGAFGINIDNTLDHGFPIGAIRPSGDNMRATLCNGIGSGSTKIYVGEILIRNMDSSPYIDQDYSTVFRISADSVTKVTVGPYNADYSKIVYYNDTEITE